MKEKEIRAKYPDIDIADFIRFITKTKRPYDTSFSGSIVIEDSVVPSYIEAYRAYIPQREAMEAAMAEEKRRRAEEEQRKVEEAQRKAEEEARLAREEEARKKKAMAQMLITSGFNFDGYKITKYSGYISGDDAMTVNRGSSFTDGGVRDNLMASLSIIRRNALRELKEAAYALGCNAVIGVDFDYITLDPQTANITGGTTYQPYVFCVTANGNAVIIEKTEDD